MTVRSPGLQPARVVAAVLDAASSTLCERTLKPVWRQGRKFEVLQPLPQSRRVEALRRIARLAVIASHLHQRSGLSEFATADIEWILGCVPATSFHLRGPVLPARMHSSLQAAGAGAPRQ